MSEERGLGLVPWIAIGALVLSGTVLGTVSPLLLVVGAWGGGDIGSVWQGIALVFGLPWLIYAVSAVAALVLLARGYRMAACVPALVPVAVEVYFARIL